MTHKEKAEAYVRMQIPELIDFTTETKYTIQPHHWLRVLRDFETTYCNYFLNSNGWLMWEETVDGNTQIEQIFRFDMTTGQPATEDDYKAFLDIVGV